MARRRFNKKRTTRRKPLRRIFRRSGPSKVIVRGAGKVFADRYFCNLRYNYVSTMVPAAVTDYRQLAVNGAFDPYLGVGGGQPMGFDQLSALYLKYRIHSSKIRIKACNLTAIPVALIVYPESSSSAPVSIENDREQRYSKEKLISAVTAGGTTTLNHAISVKKLFGTKQLDDIYSGICATANPSATAAWNVAVYSVDGTTNVSVPVQIMVEYNIEFYDPVRLGVS